MGYFSGGRFHLTVSFRYGPAPGELDFWCQLMELVSRILYDATDGQHSIGHVTLIPNSRGGAHADIWVHPNRSPTNSTNARLWFPTEALDICQDDTYYVWILAHELCHYLYDLGDEYDNNTACQGNINPTQASMMESYPLNYWTRWTDIHDNPYPDWKSFFPDFQVSAAILRQGLLSEFCHIGNHTIANNDQNNYNRRQSCWTYITDPTNATPWRNPLTVLYGLVAPGPGGPDPASSGLPASVTCSVSLLVSRFMLVLQRSDRMPGPVLDQLKVGVHFWIDYVNSGEELGFVSYSRKPTLDSGMSSIPNPTPSPINWRAARHVLVDKLVASGMTAIGDALRVGLNEVMAGGRASSQVMLLFTDGLQTAGTETAEEVLPDLIASGIRCYTISLGSDHDATGLANIATTTGARYFAIDGDLDPDEAAAAITEALIEIAGESRENGGIVSFVDVDGANAPPVLPTNYYEDQPPFRWTPESSETIKEVPLEPLKSFRFPVEITKDSIHCTLGVLWKHTKEQFSIRVYDPDGNTLGPKPGVRLVHNGNYPYAFYEIDNPKEGAWHVEVLGLGIRTARFRTIGFEVNSNIRFEVSLLEAHIKSGSEIHLRARLLTPQAVGDVKLKGWIRNPDGNWRQFKFTPHRNGGGNREKQFLYEAVVSTETAQKGQYLIVVDAYRDKGTFVAKLDELYKRVLPPEELTRTVVVPRVRRRVFLTVTADLEGRSSEEPLAGHNSKDPSIPRNQQALLERWRETHPQ